jgi:hypothetical protein
MEAEIDFLNWVFENHYRLVDIFKGVYYYKNEEGTFTVNELFEIYKKDVENLK